MEQRGSLAEMREFAVHRSAYQLKEADPHTWAIPRLEGSTKAALIRIQADEYGYGTTRRMHQQLFVETMRALGLDPTYGAYLDALPGTTLATVNLITLFGLHRRWRGALVGNLAVYEMTSVVPMGRYSSALGRLRCRRGGTRVLRRPCRCRCRASGHRVARPRGRLGARRARAVRRHHVRRASHARRRGAFRAAHARRMVIRRFVTASPDRFGSLIGGSRHLCHADPEIGRRSRRRTHPVSRRDRTTLRADRRRRLRSGVVRRRARGVVGARTPSPA